MRIAVLAALPYFSFHCSCLLANFISQYFNNFIFYKTSEKYIEIKYVKRRTETNFKSVHVLSWFVGKLVKYDVLLNGEKQCGLLAASICLNAYRLLVQILQAINNCTQSKYI